MTRDISIQKKYISGQHDARLLTVTTFCSLNQCHWRCENNWDI